MEGYNQNIVDYKSAKQQLATNFSMYTNNIYFIYFRGKEK